MMETLGRRSRSLWIGLLLALLAGCLLAFEMVRTETWQVRTVVHYEWQSEDRPDAHSAPVHGPYAFTVDPKGNLIVVDPRTNSFVTYAPDGTQKTMVKVSEPGAPIPYRIEADTTGLIYGVGPDRKNVIRYNPDGSSMPVFSQAAGDIYYIEGIGVWGSGTLYVQDVTFEKDHYTRKLTRVSPGGQTVTTLSSVEKSRAGDSRIAEKVPLPVEVDDFSVARDGTLVVVSSTQDPCSRTVTRVTPSGRMARFTVREQDFMRNCRLLGMDSEGNIYLAMVLGKEARAVVSKFNPAGQKVSDIALKGVLSPDIFGRVDPAGNFYITRTSDTGYYIDKYAKKVETHWVARFAKKKE